MPKLPGVLLKILVSYLRENLFSFLAKIACENCHNNGIFLKTKFRSNLPIFTKFSSYATMEKCNFMEMLVLLLVSK